MQDSKKKRKQTNNYRLSGHNTKRDIRIPTNGDSDIRFLIPQKGFPLQLLQLQTCSLSGTYIQHNTAVRNMIIINIQRIIHRYLQAVLILLQLNPIQLKILLPSRPLASHIWSAPSDPAQIPCEPWLRRFLKRPFSWASP